MSNKFDYLYKRIINFCKKTNSKWVLYFISFLESIIFPLPTDPFIIPYIIAENKFLRLAFFITLFSVAGGIFTYYIGSSLWDLFYPLVSVSYPNINNLIEAFEKDFSELGIVLILIGGFSPFPFKITCLACGILSVNFIQFVFASLLARGLRFFLVSFLIYKYGEKSIEIIKKNVLTASTILILLIIFYLITL